MNPAISVIVPVYNVEKTLARCVDSIFAQTFTDYEIILVDDGSTDGSGAICDSYACQYDCVRVIHKPNEGLGPTRDIGVREARGEFVYHCDSDDWLKPDLLEKVYDAITHAQADVCIFGYNLFTEENRQLKPYGEISIAPGTYDSGKEIRRLFVENYYNGFVVMSAWNKLYRRAFLLENALWFPPLRRCQDMAYSLLLFDKLERLVTLRESYYCYVIEPGVYKGRSFDEMIEIYLYMNEITTGQFGKWGLLDQRQRILLNNRCCEGIANYTSYALITKYPTEWRTNAKRLIADEKIQAIFAAYQNEKHSQFMRLFGMALKSRVPPFLHLVAGLHEKRTGTR